MFAQLADWLGYIESIHPRTIDMGLDRVNAVKERLNLQFECPVITVGGTNGKGSTCAMLEAILLRAGYRVALYTSPHLVHFNERARLQGQAVSDEPLMAQFAAVENARLAPSPIELTYFEFTTLAILRLFQAEQPDVIILEVGLGGRLDAVNAVDADCAIVTSIDLDHMEYLGDTREAIGWEKAHIYRTGKPAICADPLPPESLVQYAQQIGADLWRAGRDFNYAGDKQQWAYGGRAMRRAGLAYPALRGANQLLNAAAVLAALEALKLTLPVPNQAIREGFALVELPGRFQVLPGRPTLILDVAHNPHATATLAQNLDNMGFYPYTHVVLGMMQDKDIDGVLQAIRERVDYWYLCDLPPPRGASAASLAQRLTALLATHSPAAAPAIQLFASPTEALAAAQSQAAEGDRIVVFGSFMTVAPVLAQRTGLQS
ncbi:bifunctional tetrahydrofolate synthase/dihydrofolate synthase [Parvibium lacunae]|uniref:Dihydrofolate synthase/folylpolyglutamate synthase n=1 Tax=Parvibium lacunae TaxID=1888893 RepID=A0A368L3A8_9BURK|nr:bifunctional tetrahydrofolate synthase/dihydrofolate synthase [Parvibium lacunae]RCS58059.1 bifunctional tetrahydrofolate synthase/dihydrofolate synthase [Parvibium lacunae]